MPRKLLTQRKVTMPNISKQQIERGIKRQRIQMQIDEKTARKYTSKQRITDLKEKIKKLKSKKLSQETFAKEMLKIIKQPLSTLTISRSKSKSNFKSYLQENYPFYLSDLTTARINLRHFLDKKAKFPNKNYLNRTLEAAIEVMTIFIDYINKP